MKLERLQWLTIGGLVVLVALQVAHLIQHAK